MSLVISAPAKLNLSLSITGRRADGYHLLDSLFVFCDLADSLTISSHNGPVSFKQTGAFAGSVSAGADNLVLRAAALFAAEIGCSVDVAMRLDKVIPVAAGLGGGSADAAATLNGLNQFWGSHWPAEKLEKLAAKLGADVPACIRSEAVIARGVGDVLEAAPPLPMCGVLLVNPRVPTPTPAVFKAYAVANPLIPHRVLPAWPAAFGTLQALVDCIAERGNDLEPAALMVAPVIGDVLASLRALPGVRHVGLSGSGATCFALFDDELQAKRAVLPAAWWRWSGRML